MTRETEEELRARIQLLESILRNIGVTLRQADISSTEQTATSHLDESALLSALTPKAQRTLEYFLFGYRVPTIARLLHLSPHTIRNHLKAAFRQVGVHSQKELIEYLRRPSQSEVNQQDPGETGDA